MLRDDPRPKPSSATSLDGSRAIAPFPGPYVNLPEESPRAMAWESSERGGAWEEAMSRLGQEEETNELDMWADSIQPSGRASDGRPEGTDATSPVTISSTSDNESAPTRRT